MKKIRFILAAMVAIAGFSFVSCDKDSTEEATKNNYTRYQDAVDAQINKKNDSAILLVAFGSTWEQAFGAFDETIDAYKKAFPKSTVQLPVRTAFHVTTTLPTSGSTDWAPSSIKRLRFSLCRLSPARSSHA